MNGLKGSDISFGKEWKSIERPSNARWKRMNLHRKIEVELSVLQQSFIGDPIMDVNIMSAFRHFLRYII